MRAQLQKARFVFQSNLSEVGFENLNGLYYLFLILYSIFYFSFYLPSFIPFLFPLSSSLLSLLCIYVLSNWCVSFVLQDGGNQRAHRRWTSPKSVHLQILVRIWNSFSIFISFSSPNLSLFLVFIHFFSVLPFQDAILFCEIDIDVFLLCEWWKENHFSFRKC